MRPRVGSLTCGALVAGIMGIGLGINKIEDSYLRTFRLVKMMMAGDEKAMDDDINNFNISINKGKQLVSWFEGEFGSTLCKNICNTDFSSASQAEYFLKNQTKQCSRMIKKTARKIRQFV